MSAITATQREAIDTATETIQGNSNINSSTRVLPQATIENDSRSTSSGTQKTSTTSRRSNKSKHRSARLAKNSSLKQPQSSKRARQQKKRRQRLLATQASTTAMFCPVPWFPVPPKEADETSTRSITSTIPAQEYGSYQSHATSECSETSGIELGDPKSPLVTPPASPKCALQEAPRLPKLSNSMATPPPTSKTQALTPATQAMTEVLDESISSESSRIEMARPRALLFEESMRKIEQETQLSQRQDEPKTAESEVTTTILSPLRFVLFAILLALLATHGNKTFMAPPIDEPTIPTATAAIPTPDVESLETAERIQAAALQKAASIEQAALQQAASIEQAARQQAALIQQEALKQAQTMNEKAIAQAATITQQAHQTASTIEQATLRASVEAAKEVALQEAKTIHEQAIQTAKSIQQQALKAANLQAEAVKTQPRRKNPILQWFVTLKKKLSALREQRKQRRNAYKHQKRGKAQR